MFPSWFRKIAALAALIPLALWGCGTNTSNVRSSSKDDARVAGASDAVRLITDGLTVVGNDEAWTYTTKEGIKLPSANTKITVRYGVPKEAPDSDFKCDSLAANLVVSTDDNGLLNFTFPVTRGVDYEVGDEKGPWWLAPRNSEAPLVGFCLEDPAGKTVAWGGYGPQNEFSRLQPSLGLVAGINTLADYADLCATHGLGYVLAGLFGNLVKSFQSPGQLGSGLASSCSGGSCSGGNCSTCADGTCGPSCASCGVETSEA